MKPKIGIAAPASHLDDVEFLATHGATELYCGVSPPQWVRRYGDASWINRRSLGNLPSVEALGQLVERARSHRVGVRVAMNAPFYTGAQLPEVVALCREVVAAGAEGLIVSDLGLILALKEAGVPAEVTASSVAALRNSGACAFFAQLGVKRIVLPRYIRLEEIAEIHGVLPSVALEVFVLNDGCVYEEGFCSTTHALGAFCMTSWSHQFTRLDGAPLSNDEARALARNLDDYKEWQWNVNNCGCSFSGAGLPNGPCGLCVVWDLCQLGVSCLKIVGREAHPFRKFRSLEMVAAVVEQVALGRTRAEVAAFSRELRDTPDLCSTGYMCYFREALALQPAPPATAAGEPQR